MQKKLELRSQFVRPHLIQRLNKPIGHVNPWSFGGGLEDGGISQEGMDILKDIFSFDYMGSSEFEWGAVPAALNFIAQQSSLKTVTSGEIMGVYYICPVSYEEGVKDTIKVLLEDEHTLRLKEGCGLKDRVKNLNEWDERNVGWLELDNGFFFFTDKEMFEKTKLLFEVP
ncbi:MAG: hypothetical protein WA052_01920 [Microgenomates group bacterium]